MMRMTVEGVGFDQMQQTVVVLKDWEGKKLLPIWIGPAEARAIQIEIEGTQPPRPLAHDLLMSILGTLQVRVTRVIINDLKDSTFFATIDIDTPHGTKRIDARPSDALALAVRAKCPIYIDGNVVKELIDAEDITRLAGTIAQGAPETSEEIVGLPGIGGADDEEIARFRRLLGEELT